MNNGPVVFVHGLWLHRTSWDPWVERFRAEGYEPVAPGWPGEGATVAECRQNPDAVAGFGIAAVAEHYAAIVRDLPSKPVLIGHSFGGLLVQRLLGDGLGSAAVSIDAAPPKGVYTLPLSSLRVASIALRNPSNRKKHAVALNRKQFRYGFGNAVSEEESDSLFDRWAVPSPGRPLFEAAAANFRSSSPAKVDVANATRGPLLFVSGGRDHTVPDVVTRAAYKLYAKSPAVTELRQFPDRGHSLGLDHGWREVADVVRGWVETKVPVS
ncbi:MAG TPA: alpha/beta hydrolase [Mycobacteriales bacterium]|nr:alpha/beta hydrolase [Mycobacteriales bacterium]